MTILTETADRVHMNIATLMPTKIPAAKPILNGFHCVIIEGAIFATAHKAHFS